MERVDAVCPLLALITEGLQGWAALNDALLLTLTRDALRVREDWHNPRNPRALLIGWTIRPPAAPGGMGWDWPSRRASWRLQGRHFTPQLPVDKA